MKKTQPPPDRRETAQRLFRVLDAQNLDDLDREMEVLLSLLRGRGLNPRDTRAFLLGLYREANRHLRDFFSGVSLGEEGIVRIGAAACLEEAGSTARSENKVEFSAALKYTYIVVVCSCAELAGAIAA